MNISKRVDRVVNSENSKVFSCACYHIDQDNSYGIYNRLFIRISGKGDGTLWRCSNCKKERFEKEVFENPFPEKNSK